jgi:hypothetical protein
VGIGISQYQRQSISANQLRSTVKLSEKVEINYFTPNLDCQSVILAIGSRYPIKITVLAARMRGGNPPSSHVPVMPEGRQLQPKLPEP